MAVSSLFALLAVGMLHPSASFGQAPPAPLLLNYQGHLKNASGMPQNGTFSMTFRFFDAETGGNQLPATAPWQEVQSVAVVDGSFNVLLGSVTNLPDNLFDGGPTDLKGPLRFLEIAVADETLAPRMRIASAAYALGSRAGGGLGTVLTVVGGSTCPQGFQEGYTGTIVQWYSGATGYHSSDQTCWQSTPTSHGSLSPEVVGSCAVCIPSAINVRGKALFVSQGAGGCPSGFRSLFGGTLIHWFSGYYGSTSSDDRCWQSIPTGIPGPQDSAVTPLDVSACQVCIEE